MKMKKLTAFISAVMLAVCAVPMGAGAEYLMGDLNSNGVIDEEDGNLLVAYWQWGQWDENTSEEEHEFYKTYGDFSGDGIIDHDDIEIFNEICIESDVTLNTEIGDVNHDGYVNAVDATLILIYYADLSTGKEYKYTEAQNENFRIYGDMCDMGDGAINAADASAILILYAKRSTSVFPTIE
ncbi:MAG: hypothetical protein K2L10_06135 [Ruminococcus sp.]|nr:hypothetical protein [Ruminococcus sp.]